MTPLPARVRHQHPFRRLLLAVVPLLWACSAGPEPETAREDAPEPVQLLLLVSVDTLRADRVGAFGSDLGLTPNIDALVGESARFDAAYAAAPFTLPALAALMTGRSPEALGIVRNESALPEGFPTLASELRARGWRTAAVVSNYVLRRSSGIAQGFEHFDDDFPQSEVVRHWPERIAADTTDAAIAALAGFTAESDERLFLWIHYQDPHGPYTPPEELRERELARERAVPGSDRILPLSPDHLGIGGIPDYQVLADHRDVGFYRAGYHAEIRYLDAEVGRLLRELDARGLRQHALIVFTADHGEGLGEDDYWFAHGEYLHEAQVRIPLAIRRPGRPSAQRSDIASSLDVLPTLLAALGEAPASDPGSGRDLFAPGAAAKASRPYFATLFGSRRPRFGIIEGGFKFVISEREGIWDGRLTRVGNDAIDVTAAAPQIAGPMRRRLLRMRAKLVQKPEVRQELSDQERENLRALGYLDAPDGS